MHVPLVSDPVEEFEVVMSVMSSKASLNFSWSPPSVAAHLTTGYTLTCTPLLERIPTPEALMLGQAATTANMTGLYSGVTYNCEIITIGLLGSSEPQTLVLTTPDIGINYLLQVNNCKSSL